MGLIDGPLGIVVAVLVVAWLLIGIAALTSALAWVLWAAIGLAVVLLVYFSGVRVIKFGRGDSEW